MIAKVETGCGGNGTVIAGAGGGLCVTGSAGGSAVNLFGITSPVRRDYKFGGVGDDTSFVVTFIAPKEQR